MRKVIAYVKGLISITIDDLSRPHLKWLDLHALAKSICGADETLAAVKYFSAYATWRTGAIGRHRTYVAALKHAGVECVIGHFKEKHRRCATCGATWIGHEQKETDVAIAVELTVDAFTDAFHRALIVSADSDLAPAVRSAHRNFPDKTINVIAPPGRKGHARDLNPLFEITPGRLAKCLLPDSAKDGDGKVLFVRPAAWSPPR